jgi:hypothetical protein
MSRGVFPETTTPAALAEHMGWSERRVRNKARELGACRVLGNRMVLLPEDVRTIMEASRPCPLKSSSEAVSGITAGPLPGGDYAALQALRTKKSPQGSRPRSKTRHGNVVSMVRDQS